MFTQPALGRIQVVCETCEASGPTEETDEEAVEAWNRRAPASEVQADHIADERQAFEEWCLTFCGVGVESLEQTIGGAYVSGYVDDMWDGWKARAGLASSTGNQEVGS